MPEVVLFDVDGVVIRPRQKYFSEKYSQDYNIPLEQIGPFFRTEYKKVATGQEDIKILLPSYLKEWGWTKTVDEFLAYWFESEKDIDTQLLRIVANLREKGVKCYLVSDNEKYRGQYLMQSVGLADKFDGAFFSYQLGVTKSKPEFFSQILEKLSIAPQDTIYWDDDPKNVASAITLGLSAFVYDDYGEFVRKLDELFPKEMQGFMAFNTEDFYCDMVFSGKVQVKKVRETDELLAFHHTRPSWTHHIVVVPKKHVKTLTEVQDMVLIRRIFELIKEIILENGWDNTNFKIINNGGSFQDSKHLHFHLVSGEKIR